MTTINHVIHCNICANLLVIKLFVKTSILQSVVYMGFYIVCGFLILFTYNVIMFCYLGSTYIQKLSVHLTQHSVVALLIHVFE